MCNSQTNRQEIEINELKEWKNNVFRAFSEVTMDMLIRQQKGKRIFVSVLEPLADIMHEGIEERLIDQNKEKVPR